MSSTVFGFVQGASLCFCSTKTLPAVAGTKCLLLPMVAKGEDIEKRLWKRLMKSGKDIIAITDQKGIIKKVNSSFCKITKYSEEELIGQDHRIINSGYHSKEFIRDLWVTIANGKIWKGEFKNKAKDGNFYWVDTTIVPFLDEQGKPYQYLAIRVDITDRKEVEESLTQRTAQLETAKRSEGRIT